MAVNEFQILQTKLENLKLILDGKAKEEDRLFDEFLNKVLRSKRELETEEHKLKKMLAAASGCLLAVLPVNNEAWM